MRARPDRAAGLCALALLAAPAAAADSENATGEAELLDGFSLVNVDSLDYGRIVPTGAGGAVTINPSNNTRTAVGQTTLIGSDYHRALFTMKAPVGTVMIITGDTNVTLTHSGGVATMDSTLVHRAGSGLVTTMLFGAPIAVMATAPDQEIYSGGTLAVAGTQLPGLYSGTYSITVVYP